MNRIFLLACLLLPCSLALGQTNTPATPALAPSPPPFPGPVPKAPAEPKQNPPALLLSATNHSSAGLSLLPHSDNPLESPRLLGTVSEILHSPLYTTNSPLPTPNSPLSSAPPTLNLLQLDPPKWTLRPLPARPEDALSKPPPLDAGTASLHEMGEVSPGRQAGIDRLVREGLLIPPAPKYDSEIDRTMAAAFRPEIIHLGHAQFTCSLITAIARRNPFCLLDPAPIGISF